MKTAVSLPDDLYDEAEKLADELGKSRSQLYQEAVREYVYRHQPEAITEAMNRVVDELDSRPDPFLTEAARRILERTEW